MASKYYAVKKGKVPGIYLNWNDCKAGTIAKQWLTDIREQCIKALRR